MGLGGGRGEAVAECGLWYIDACFLTKTKAGTNFGIDRNVVEAVEGRPFFPLTLIRWAALAMSSAIISNVCFKYNVCVRCSALSNGSV